MDKVKIILAIAKKHHFWALCGLVLVISLVVWWKATGSLAQQFGARKSAIEGAFGKMTGVSGMPDHPNDKVVERIQQETAKLKGEVFTIWEGLYKEQKDNNKLPDNLSPGFKDAFWDLDIEMNYNYRDEYRTFITGGHFKWLFEEELNVLRPKEPSGGEVGPGGPDRAADRGAGGVAENSVPPRGSETKRREYPQRRADQATSGQEMIGIVRWENRDSLLNLFRWPPNYVPTDKEVRNAQENLWVIEALVKIIKRTNEGASGPYNAAIKEIKDLAIGANAVDAWRASADSVVHLGEAPKTEGDLTGRDVDRGRYVDDDGALLGPGEESPYAEFKMMPIWMNLVMDQTRIPELLVQCANSELPIEVRNVLLNPGQGDMLDVGGAEEGVGGASAAAGGAGRLKTPPELAASLDIPVEIHGIIYLYNPPDKDKLGTGAGAEEPAPGTVPEATPAQPIATPAAAPPGGK